jgi:3-oxoacyl-[acyl-carrier-protein] synthase II
MRRVVITGLGVVSPLGNNVQTFWKNLIASKSAIQTFPTIAHSNIKWNDKIPAQLAASINPDDFVKNHLQPYLQLPSCHKDIVKSRLTPFIQYALVAAHEALTDANWNPRDLSIKDQLETGVVIGAGMPDIDEITEVHDCLQSNNYKRVNPLFIPKMLINMPAGYVSIQHQLKGPNQCVSTACATGAQAIADAYRYIQFGDAKVMVAGGTEASLNAVCFAGFSRLRALSMRNTVDASCPFDAKRDGFIMGEGAGIVVLEDYEHAKERGAKIYAEMIGYGLSGDAYHVTSPSPDGAAALAVMKRAVSGDVMASEDHPAFDSVDYVNAHATSTKVGDRIEMNAIMKLFGKNENLRVSSIKGAIGHLLGASGAVEAIATILSVKDNVIPITLNLTELDEDLQCEDTYKRVFMVGEKGAKVHEIRKAISNSFGFGGTNASLCFQKF